MRQPRSGEVRSCSQPRGENMKPGPGYTAWTSVLRTTSLTLDEAIDYVPHCHHCETETEPILSTIAMPKSWSLYQPRLADPIKLASPASYLTNGPTRPKKRIQSQPSTLPHDFAFTFEMAITGRKQQRCKARILDLSLELRTMIYRHVFHDMVIHDRWPGSEIHPRSEHVHRRRRSVFCGEGYVDDDYVYEGTKLALLSVCRLFRREAYDVFLSSVMFDITSTEGAFCMYLNLGSVACKKIKKIMTLFHEFRTESKFDHRKFRDDLHVDGGELFRPTTLLLYQSMLKLEASEAVYGKHGYEMIASMLSNDPEVGVATNRALRMYGVCTFRRIEDVSGNAENTYGVKLGISSDDMFTETEEGS